VTVEPGRALLDATLRSWDLHQEVLVNLLRALPAGGLAARATATSPTVAQIFHHLHHERTASLLENSPEHAGEPPASEWSDEHDVERLAALLDDSARRVREAVRERVEAGRGLDQDFAHPVQMLHFLVFHEAYHHGQIKLALKAAGTPLPDAVAGPLTWHAWRRR
jgi:uncharacterized damage-inducible protein DinB